MVLLIFPGVSLVFGRGDYLPTAAFFLSGAGPNPYLPKPPLVKSYLN